MTLPPSYRVALEFIRNANRVPTIEWFDDFQAPIGSVLRQELKALGLITYGGGTGDQQQIHLTPAGEAALC